MASTKKPVKRSAAISAQSLPPLLYPQTNATTPTTVPNMNGGLASSIGNPSVAATYDPYEAGAKEGESLFNSMGNEILAGTAGGSFGTGVTNTPSFTDGLASKLTGAWDTIGGAKGFADLASGLGSLGSLYTGYKQNKMAEQEHNARMSELARQRQRDLDWQKNIGASGLGTYTAGLAQNAAGVK